MILLLDKKYSAAERKKATASGAAMKGGRFPIKSAEDVANAVKDYNRIGQPADVKAHIIKRAKELGATGSLPDDWKVKDAAEEDDICPTCAGEGEVDGVECEDCGGTGVMDDDEMEDGVATQMVDALELVDGKLRKTNDGYLTGIAKVSRTGIQIYKGFELGKPQMDEVRVYRPAEQVFAKDAIRSMAHKPTTLLHPKEMVDSSNWKQYATGYTGDDVLRDGESVKVPLILTDQAAIDAYEKHGVKELSMGYTTDIVWKSGKTKAGEAYDAIQTNIRANHLAIVPTARAGSDFRLGDERSKTGAKKMKVITVDGLPVEVADDNSGAIISRHIAKLEAGVADVTRQFDAFKKKADDEDEEDDKKAKDAKATLDAKVGEIAALTSQLADEKKKTTPEALDALVKERQATIDAASTLLDAKKYVFDGKKIEDIRRDAVKVKLGDDGIKGMSDDAISGAFKSLTADAKKNNGVRRMADAIGQGQNQSTAQQTGDAAVTQAFDEREKGYQNAWKGGNRPGFVEQKAN